MTCLEKYWLRVNQAAKTLAAALAKCGSDLECQKRAYEAYVAEIKAAKVEYDACAGA